MTIPGNRLALAGAVGLGALVVLAGVAWLAFGFFGIQTAFTDEQVDEGGPVFAGGSGEEADGTGALEGSAEFEEAMDEAAANPKTVDDAMMDGEIVTVVSGTFSGSTGHSVVGDALVLNDGSEQRFLRLEKFESQNGPDLKVYLRAADDEFVNLGELKGNIGDQNYEIPAGIDLEQFSTVQIWCERFSVLFGAADLS